MWCWARRWWRGRPVAWLHMQLPCLHFPLPGSGVERVSVREHLGAQAGLLTLSWGLWRSPLTSPPWVIAGLPLEFQTAGCCQCFQWHIAGEARAQRSGVPDPRTHSRGQDGEAGHLPEEQTKCAQPCLAHCGDNRRGTQAHLPVIACALPVHLENLPGFQWTQTFPSLGICSTLSETAPPLSKETGSGRGGGKQATDGSGISPEGPSWRGTPPPEEALMVDAQSLWGVSRLIPQ